MRCICEKFIHCFLTIKQKEHHFFVILQEVEMDQNLIEGIIRGDKAWVYRYDQGKNVNLCSGSHPSLHN
jgi:predicted transcriptional regulator